MCILGLLGIDASTVSGLIGLTCSPISVVGVGSGSACSGTSVSCSNGIVVSIVNSCYSYTDAKMTMIAQGGIGIGCVPVSL